MHLVSLLDAQVVIGIASNTIFSSAAGISSPDNIELIRNRQRPASKSLDFTKYSMGMNHCMRLMGRGLLSVAEIDCVITIIIHFNVLNVLSWLVRTNSAT